MAAAGRRRGRRNNGLDAASWRAIDDLDPRTSEDVLDVLGARGIAAYVQPAMDVDPITRSATVPSRPSDRLYVDRGQVEAARLVLRRLFDEPQARPDDPGAEPGGPEPAGGAEPSGPEPSRPEPSVSEPSVSEPSGGTTTDDLDATFAGIVAGFDQPVSDPTAGWPAAENLPADDRRGATTYRPEPDDPGDATGDTTPAGQPPADPGQRPAPLDARHVTESSLLDGLDTFGADLPDEPTERFVPPPPPPLPRLSRQTVLGALAVLAGLVLLLGRPQLLPLERSTTMLLGFAAILGGAVALILRLRPGTDPDPDDGTHPDDGARV